MKRQISLAAFSHTQLPLPISHMDSEIATAFFKTDTLPEMVL